MFILLNSKAIRSSDAPWRLLRKGGALDVKAKIFTPSSKKDVFLKTQSIKETLRLSCREGKEEGFYVLVYNIFGLLQIKRNKNVLELFQE